MSITHEQTQRPLPSLVPAIDASHLCFSRNNEVLLDDFSFVVQPGEYVAVIGPNGGGKSTLLRLLLGLQRPTSGTIRLFGCSVDSPHALMNVGYIPQRGGLIDPLFPSTVEEVVRAGRSQLLPPWQWFGDHDEERVAAACETMNMTHLRHRVIGSLSGGERQRVLLARALAADPGLLILDEPVDGLDPASREDFYATLKRINKAGTAILFVTHDVHRIAVEADSAICLKHELVCHGAKTCMISGHELRNIRHASHKELVDHHGA